MKRWFELALSPTIVRRSLRVGLVVGTLLTAINQGDVLLAGDITGEVLAKILLTYCVPYSVSTYAGVGALLEKDRS
ncbi:MAG: nitrate/nitrite transporter NrtS [Pseudomonadota bacterium]